MDSYTVTKGRFKAGQEFEYSRHSAARSPRPDEGAPGDFWSQKGSPDVIYLKVSVDHWQVLSNDTLNVKFPLEPPASLKRDDKKNFAKYRPYRGILSWRNASSKPSAISSPNTDSIAEQPRPLKRTKTLCSPAVNGWVTDLLSQWNNPFTVSINSSTTVEGILDCIATTSFHIPFFQATLDDQPPECLIQFHERPSSIIHPHPSLILGDILASEPEDIIVSHAILGHLTDIPTVRDIVYTFLTATTHSSPSHDENEAALYSILKVPFTPNGMGLCQLQSPFPDDFDGVYDRKPLSKSPDWSSAFTPPGSITGPHIDWYGAAEMMYHVSGEKLWFLWPGTPENLETLYNWKHKSPNNGPTITITEAITRLKGLQLVFFSAPCAWELPPCTIHACLGFSFSGHLGVAFWSPRGFSTAQWTIKFYLSECQQRFSTVCDDTQGTLEDFMTVSQKELLQWRSVFSKRDGRGGKELEWIERMLKTIRDTQASLSRIQK
ncbi:hypothetical protein PM082_006704 [Marasmius tenuissimus]|nr:hypothetical protein PM082_006704 [Marasmius tenuissimus]